MEGSSEDGGNVRLSEFLDQLEAIRAALRSLRPPTPGVRRFYRIVGLSQSSPAQVVLEEVEEQVTDRKVTMTLLGLKTGAPAALVDRLNDLQSAKLAPPDYIRSVSDLDPYVDIGEPLRKHMKAVVLEFDRKRVELTKTYPGQVKEILGPDTRELGNVSGRLERVSVRGRNKFDIYPAVGPKKVTCIFPERLLEKVASGLGKYVTVEGMLHFKRWDRLPYKVVVRDLPIVHEKRGAVSLLDIRGLQPGISGDLSSEDFIEKQRDEDDW